MFGKMSRGVKFRKVDKLSLMFPHSLDLIRVQAGENDPMSDEVTTEEKIVENWPCSIQSLTDGDVKAIGGTLLKDEFLILCPCIDGLNEYNSVSNDTEVVSGGNDFGDLLDGYDFDDPMADEDPMSDEGSGSSSTSSSQRRYYTLVLHINGKDYTIEESGVYGIEFIENQYVFDLQGYKIGCKIRVKTNTNLMI